MRTRSSTLPLMLPELVRIEPLMSASALHLAVPHRRVEQVVLAETFERLRRAAPHALVVLHAEAASGGWSLAAALHLAWERNLSGVVVTRSVAGPSSAALARRLNVSLLVIEDDPVDVALRLAGHISTPEAARALRQALCAEELAEQTTVRGVLAVLNAELAPTQVALMAGEAVLAGRVTTTSGRADDVQVSVEVTGSGEPAGVRLVASVPGDAPMLAPQVQALLRLARPSLFAAWARTRLDAASHAASESAAFSLLRRLAAEPAAHPPDPQQSSIEIPAWSSHLGWHLDGSNRAVWFAQRRSGGPPPQELTFLVRSAWQRGRSTWPLIPQDEGWISWYSAEKDDPGPLRRALAAFREAASTFGLVVGVGRAHPGVAGLLRSVAEARLAAQVARHSDGVATQWFDQVGAAAALAYLPVTQIGEVAVLCLPDLVTTADRAALTDTVLTVLDCGGSLVEAAHLLGVHRNTVLARVARARQLGLDFDDPNRRLAIHLLCYALAAVRDLPSAPGVALPGPGAQPSPTP